MRLLELAVPGGSWRFLNRRELPGAARSCQLKLHYIYIYMYIYIYIEVAVVVVKEAKEG